MAKVGICDLNMILYYPYSVDVFCVVHVESTHSTVFLLAEAETPGRPKIVHYFTAASQMSLTCAT